MAFWQYFNSCMFPRQYTIQIITEQLSTDISTPICLFHSLNGIKTRPGESSFNKECSLVSCYCLGVLI